MIEPAVLGPILVTGAAGYIGSHVANALQRRGCVVVGLDNFSNGSCETLNPQIVFYQADIKDMVSLRQVFKKHNFSTVIHLAGMAIVEESFLREDEYKENNIEGTRNVLICCEEFEVKNLIFSSSSTLYGNINGPVKLKEDSQLSPINPYGRTKLACEGLIQQSRLNFIVLRYFNVAGAAQDLKNGPRGRGSQRLFFHLSKAAITQNPFIINGSDYPTSDGTCIRDYIYIEDIVDIHWQCLLYLAQSEEARLILNCGYGKGCSVAEAIHQFELHNQVCVPQQVGPRRQGDPDHLVGDTERIRKILKWESKFEDPLKEICISTYRWMKVN